LGSKVHEEELKNYSGGDFQVAKGVQFKTGMYFVKILIDGWYTNNRKIDCEVNKKGLQYSASLFYSYSNHISYL
jgi:hypothetical protein